MFQINIDPESLKPKLPSRRDLKPYPITCYLEYKGHKGAVMSISTEASGQWIASGLDSILCLYFHSDTIKEYSWI
jgi:ribosome biogenesis protein ERB1